MIIITAMKLINRNFPFFFVLLLLPEILFGQIINDECTTATTISSLPFTISQNTRLASPNIYDPALTCQDSVKNGKTVWFKYTADTSRFIVFNTIGSEPVADYDIIMAMFIGTCGNLSQIQCNDDTLDTRQSAFGVFVTAGTTYYIMIGEWGGGGTNGGVPTGGDLILKVYVPEIPPLVRGPKNGMVNNGVVTSTDNFLATTEMPTARPKIIKPNVNKRVEKLPLPKNIVPPLGQYGSNYFEDRSSRSVTETISRPVAMQNFEGIPETNFIPPDPMLAVGPDHIMVAVNSTFRIFDKNGNILKTIDSDLWFDQVVSGASTFDPILMYDHFDQRWIYEMLHVSDSEKKAYILLGVSDDSNPLGLWYNWAIPANMIGDSVVSNWTDYARVGFDKDAIYITGNQFGFTTDFFYSKLRVIPKKQLYQNNAHAISWKDFWDFRDPDNLQTVIFGLRPSISFGNSEKQFLLNDSPYFFGNFFTLWTVDSILTNPSITASNVPVVQYFPSPNADQFEGGRLQIDAQGADIRNEPIYRDSALWAVHAVASGTHKQYSSVRYVKFDPFNKHTVEDISFGLEGYWHSYPALMINSKGEMTITYSRSGSDEYVGAFMTGRKKNDPPGLSSSVSVHDGRGNYVVDFGTGRNRWGDYSGIGLDPSDGISIWTHTEFAAAKNTWGTWVARTLLGPVSGSKLTVNRTYVNFGTKNTGTTSDTISITLTNDGVDTMFISSLTTATGQFKIVSLPQFPVRIPSLGTYSLRIYFAPTSSGKISDSIMYCSTQPCIVPKTLVTLTGTGFQMVPAQQGTLYASSNAADGGNLYSINSATGEPTFIARTGLYQVTSLRVHPVTKELIGLDPTGTANGGVLYRISATGSSLQKISSIEITNIKGLTFIDDSLAYFADFNGRIFRVNIYSGTTKQITATGLRIGGLAVNPTDGSLWFCLRATSGILDGIYKYNFTADASVLVGQTGLGMANADLIFDKSGTLYVLAGINTAQNKLLVIDTANGSAKHVYEIGKSNIAAIALNPDAVAEILNEQATIPAEFSLRQNYPNPFNPLTVIQYSLPTSSMVKLIVYDELGRIVQTLAEGIRPPGIHREYFDATGLASGIYYYHISAGNFTKTNKMLFLK
jgi:hypothetical protein